MPSIHFELARAHHFPFLWPDAPVEKRIPVSRVAGRIDNAGYHHNAFANIFDGHRIPPNRLHVVNLRHEDPKAAEDVMKEILIYNTAIIHVYHHEQYGLPAVLSVASLLGSVVLIELYQPDPLITRPLEVLKRRHPDLHRVFTDPLILRLTTSYEATLNFLTKNASPNLGRDVVDLLLVGNLVRQRDFACFGELPDATEELGLQVLVWSFLGTQYGPTPSKSKWLAMTKGTGQEWDENRKHLYRFRKGSPLNPSQTRWMYQVARAGIAAGLHGSRQTLLETEMDLSESYTRDVLSASLRRLRSKAKIRQRGWWTHVLASRALTRPPKTKNEATSSPAAPAGSSPVSEGSSPVKARHLRTPKPPARRSPSPESDTSDSVVNNNNNKGSRPGSLAQAKANMYARNAPLKRASPKRSKDRRRSSPSSPRKRRNVRPSPPRLKEDRDSARAEARRSRSPSRRRSPSRHRARRPSADPRLESPERRHRRSTVPEGAVHRGRGPRYYQFIELDKEIRRRRQNKEERQPLDQNPMGPQFCQSCAMSPPHLRPEDCEVMKYATGSMPSKRGVLPCVVCSSKRHTSKACPHMQQRCRKCQFMGHGEDECEERSSEEWLVHYLLHVHRCRLTRSNPRGPLGGPHGFGDISQLRINDLVRRLIQEKQQSLLTLQAAYPDEPEPESELHAAWMMLIQEQENHQKQVDEDALRLQNDLVNRVADALGREQGRQHTATKKSTSTKSSWTKTEIIVSPATPEHSSIPDLETESHFSVHSDEEAELLKDEPMDTHTEPSSSSTTQE